MDRVVGSKDTSFEPSAEDEQGRGQTTRHYIGKGWGDTTHQGQRHMIAGGKRVHYPLKYFCVFGCNCPDDMEVWVRPSQTLRNL